jgi:hypothetical protein
MSCIRHFLNFTWECHTWRRRVTSFETLTDCPETDMWARPVYRDYIRCDKEEVCVDCGAVRHQVSCLCDPEKAERCRILLDHIQAANATSHEDRLNV